MATATMTAVAETVPPSAAVANGLFGVFSAAGQRRCLPPLNVADGVAAAAGLAVAALVARAAESPAVTAIATVAAVVSLAAATYP